MAETINLKKRLIGREDINFDITGTNETENFFTADGGQKKVSKINASHFPLTRNAREKLNATNVDEALVLLSGKVDDFEAADVLTEDITINFLSEDDIETIQNKINQQKKNLNGHTLTFVFPSYLAQNLYATLEWKDFFNGTVIITGGSSGSRITIYDRQNITSLFRIYRCLCEVRIEYFYFVHQHSPYAVSAESSSAVILKDCFFSGIEDADSYAVRLLASNGELADCQLSNDFDYDTLLSERLFEIEETIKEKNIEQDEKLNDLEENKAQKDLANVKNPVQAFKDMVITWSLPNYAAGVDYTSSYIKGVGLTIPGDGWCFCKISSESNGIFVNGGVVCQTNGADPFMLFPVKKGDDLTIRILSSGNITTNYIPEKIIIYPNR
jgi:hypothetical protein